MKFPLCKWEVRKNRCPLRVRKLCYIIPVCKAVPCIWEYIDIYSFQKGKNECEHMCM